MTTTRKNPVSTPYPTGAITDKSAINKAVLVENKSLVMVGSRGHCSHALAAAQGMASDDKLHTYLVTGGSGCHLEDALETALFENHPYRPWHADAARAIAHAKGWFWAVGRNALDDGGRSLPLAPTAYYESEKAAKAAIAEIEKTDPQGVHAGHYFIDSPSED